MFDFEDGQVFVRLPLKKAFRAKVERDDGEWKFEHFRSLEVDVVPILAPILAELMALTNRRVDVTTGAGRRRVVDLLETWFEAPPEIRPRCSWVYPGRPDQQCPSSPTVAIGKLGCQVGTLCPCHADEFERAMTIRETMNGRFSRSVLEPARFGPGGVIPAPPPSSVELGTTG